MSDRRITVIRGSKFQTIIMALGVRMTFAPLLCEECRLWTKRIKITGREKDAQVYDPESCRLPAVLMRDVYSRVHAIFASRWSEEERCQCVQPAIAKKPKRAA